jgi:hypothetical protein
MEVQRLETYQVLQDLLAQREVLEEGVVVGHRTL